MSRYLRVGRNLALPACWFPLHGHDGENRHGWQSIRYPLLSEAMASRYAGKCRPPACAAQLGIADAFVGPAAFAIKVWLSFAWQRSLKVIGKPRVNLGLSGRRCYRSRCIFPVVAGLVSRWTTARAASSRWI